MVPTTTSPGETASSHGVRLVEEVVFGRAVSLIVVLIEEAMEIFDFMVYIHLILSWGWALLLVGCVQPLIVSTRIYTPGSHS